jgi:hypothetical protein
MNGQLQMFYDHSVLLYKLIDSKHCLVLVLLFQRGIETFALCDTGEPAIDLFPIHRTRDFTTNNHPNLKDGGSYKYMTLTAWQIHRCIELCLRHFLPGICL